MSKSKRSTIIINELSTDAGKNKSNTLTTIKKKELLEILSQNNGPFVEIDLHTDKYNPNANLTPVKTKGAKQLAKALTTNTTIQALNLKGNSIGKQGALELKESLKNNTHLSLVELNIEGNSLENEGVIYILDAVSNYSNLRVLDLGSNNIREEGMDKVKDLIANNTSLRELRLSNNPKVGKQGTIRLCQGLKENESIEILEARKIGIGKKGSVYISNVLKENNTLTSLDIAGNSIQDSGLKQLLVGLSSTNSLIKLNLSDNGLTRKSAKAISDVILQHQSLRFVDLSNNSFGKSGAFEIAEGLKSNNSLFTLKFANNGIGSEGASTIFQSLTHNKSVTYLDLSKNKINDKADVALSKVFKDNSSLRTLLLTNNSFQAPTISESLQTNSSLTALYMSENPLKTPFVKTLAESIRKNSALVVLELKLVDIKREAETALYQTFEESLVLASIWVNTIFFSRKQIVNQGLTTFPLSFLQMNHLKAINLSDNRIEELPYRIGELKCLKELILRNNKLQSLPYSLALLPSLKVIEVSGNPIKVPPIEIVKKGRKEILGYLKDLAEGAEPCYRTKVMVVGQENVGKTTLINKLQNRKQRTKTKGTIKGVNTANISTDGIDIDLWNISVLFKTKEDPKPRKQTVSVSVWDFAGQDIYYTSHQFFLSERCIYILVFDLRYEEENSRVEYWLQSIYSRAKTSPVIIVGTHADDAKCTTEYLQGYIGDMQSKYTSRFPNIRKFIVADVTNDVKNVLISIKECISSQIHMGEPMPLTYIELEKVIIAERDKRKEEGKPPIVSWKDWIKMGNIANISEEGTLLRATKLFHELGVVVYIDDKRSGLNDIVILSPQYLTTLMSTVITTKHRFVKEGILYHKDLSQIWRDSTLFPPNLHAFFLALMEKFEISLNLDSKSVVSETIDVNGRSLIPSLLPENEPNTLEWATLDQSRLQLDRFYELEFIPHGFFSRLIIRMMRLADQVIQYWKNGGIFSKGKDLFFIRMAPTQKTLKITIRSKDPVPLARSIMETIANLITNWFHVNVREMVPCPHCIVKSTESPFIFSVDECTQAIASGGLTLKCQGKTPIPLKEIVPDIALSDVDLPKLNFETDITLGKQLGKGAFGEIYEGTWRGRSYAVKKLILEDEEDLEHTLTVFHEFRREVWLMSRLLHPCVINLVAFSFNPFSLIMEKASEGALYNFLHDDKQALNWHLRIRIALDIAQGMQALHNFDPPLVHRDLKSPNILLVSTSESAPVLAKVSDFGTAMQLYIDAFKESSSERTVALPTWLAPEVIGEVEYTEKSDVYAMGIMMWELLTRKHPFEEYTWMADMEDAILEGQRPKIPADCPSAWRNLMRSCWDPEPDQRPSFNAIVEILYEKVLPSVSPGFKVNLVKYRKPTLVSNEKKIILSNLQEKSNDEKQSDHILLEN